MNAAWLAEHVGAPDLRVLEATVYLSPRDGGYDVRSGREDWAAGHIPGSAFADLIDDLSEPHATLNFTFPAPGRFAAAMSALGVEDGTAVVVYDRNGTMWATRLWWLLHAYGFENAAVLDGGLAAWEGELTAAPAPTHEAEFTPRPHPRRIAVRAEVEQRAGVPDQRARAGRVQRRAHPGQHEFAEPRPARSGFRPLPPTRGIARAHWAPSGRSAAAAS